MFFEETKVKTTCMFRAENCRTRITISNTFSNVNNDNNGNNKIMEIIIRTDANNGKSEKLAIKNGYGRVSRLKVKMHNELAINIK